MQRDIDWQQLETKGFVLVRSFLSSDEIERLIADYSHDATTSEHRSYFMKFPTPAAVDLLAPKQRGVVAHVRDATALDVNLPVGSAYFVTVPPKPMKPQAFAWHQDHEDWFAFQDHYNCLNFYIPLIKPDRERSNLTVLPFDVVEATSPAAHARLVGGGARHFFRTADGQTEVEDDNDDARYVLDIDIDALATTPLLAAGDLLLSRGDIVHKTQDADTERVAIKVVMMDAAHVVTRRRLREGGITKYSRLLKNLEFYASIARCFATKRRDEVALGELVGFLEETYYADQRNGVARTPVSVPAFLEEVTRTPCDASR